MPDELPQPRDLHDQFQLEQVAEDVYTSKYAPGRMGNAKNIAYGGATTSMAVAAAFKTVKAEFHLYSLLGYFLGPSLTDRHVTCNVYRSRDTKSFATRRVVLTQLLDDGSDRKCLELIADFQRKEPAAAMEFLPPTSRQYLHPSQAPNTEALRDQFVAKGLLTKTQGNLLDSMFSLSKKFFETVPCVEGITGQNMMGFGKALPTDQDHLHITDKVSAEWFRARGVLPSTAEQMSALAFNMDGGLSFIPLIHDHKFLDDAGACSSLDFALRIFTDRLDLTKWHVKERKTIAGQGGRTYSEARLYDEAGNLVAIESQQSIMRPLPSKKAKI